MLIDRLNEDLKAAMKARESLRLAVLRMTMSEIKNARIEKGKDATLTDDEVMQVLRRAVKKREEAAEAYRLGGRAELAGSEEKEAEILATYLPRMLEGEALEKVVDEAIAEAGAKSVKDMGKVMKLVMAAHGAEVDGKKVQQVVRVRLGGDSGSLPTAPEPPNVPS